MSTKTGRPIGVESTSSRALPVRQVTLDYKELAEQLQCFFALRVVLLGLDEVSSHMGSEQCDCRIWQELDSGLVSCVVIDHQDAVSRATACSIDSRTTRWPWTVVSVSAGACGGAGGLASGAAVGAVLFPPPRPRGHRRRTERLRACIKP